MDYGPQTPMNTTTVTTAVLRRWACHTRTVLRTDACGRQRCNVVLSACSYVYMWCVSWAVCSLEGNKNRKNTGTYVQKQASCKETREIVVSTPEKKKLQAPSTRATALGSSSNLDDRFCAAFHVDVVLGFWLNALVRRDKFENRRKFHKHTYTYKALRR